MVPPPPAGEGREGEAAGKPRSRCGMREASPLLPPQAGGAVTPARLREASMATEIRVPALGESVTEATVARWLKKKGEGVRVDDPVVELETDKVTLEVNAPAAGTIAEIAAEEGSNV